MNILINRLTNKVEGINSPSTPFNYVVEVDDSINPTKTIEEQDGEIQKTNEEGEPLYKHEIYRIETKQVLVGRDEVLEDTGVPVMIKAQKTNEEGLKLYLEPLYEGEEIIDYVEVTEAFDEDGTPNEPIIIDVQKTSVGGRPLYYKDITEIVEEKILERVEETTDRVIITKWDTVISKVPQVVGTETVVDEETGEEIEVDKIEEVETELQVPSEQIELEPIMIPNIVSRTYDLKSNFGLFTAEDILEAKYQHILDESQKDYIIGDMFINEDDIDLEDEKHSANTGQALLELLPNGQAKTKSIELEVPTKEFKLLDFVADEGVEIYLSGKKFTNGILTLSSPISNCTIKFVNITDKPKSIKSYAIGY